MQVRNRHVKLSPPDDETTGRYMATKIELHCAAKEKIMILQDLWSPKQNNLEGFIGAP